MNTGTKKREYIDYLFLELRLSELTRETYGREVDRFLIFLSKSGIKPEFAASEDLVNYLSFLHKDGLDSVTISKSLSCLRSFFRFLNYEGYRDDNPTDKIESQKNSSPLPDVLSPEEINHFLNSISTDGPLGVRDRALFELIYSCGLRISEAVNLIISNVSFEDALIRVNGKRNKDRLVPFGSQAEKWLRVYLDKGRSNLVKTNIPDDHLFLGARGKGLSRKGIWKRFKEIKEKAGLEAKVHTLRHSFATHLVNGGADLRIVQELLGHSNITTTQIYTHIQNTDLQKKHDSFHPLNDEGPESNLNVSTYKKEGVF
jgi:integrase/recombinase XerD